MIGLLRDVVETLTRAQLTPEQEATLRNLLGSPRYELVPVSGALGQIRHLPAGSSVSVTASPTRTLDDTLDLCAALIEAGHRAIPHLAARMVADRAQLAGLLARIDSLGITEAFVIGGDGPQTGAFADAGALLDEIDRIGSGLTGIGVAAYPEGHHVVDDETALSALRSKQPKAAWMTTQLCFDDRAIVRWLTGVRAAGVDLPAVIGVAGVADRRKLLAISTRIGVGQSVRYLAKNRGLVRRVLTPGGYTPGHLLANLGAALVDPALDIAGLHLYTFNQVETTERWRLRFLERL